MIETKFPKESSVTMTEIVLPNDTNLFNNLMGGRLMHWMDIISSISAQKHSGNMVVTASVDNISFKSPIQLGSVVTLKARVTRAFKSSMEILIDVQSENIVLKKKVESNSAYFTFVALDKQGNPTLVPQIKPETEEEKEEYKSALRRQQLRLILAKRMDPADASELKTLFTA